MSTQTVIKTERVESILTHCGHVIYLPVRHMVTLQRSHKNFYCTVCGKSNYWAGRSDLEQLKREITTVKDQRDTARRNYHDQKSVTRGVRRSLTAHKGHTTRIKKRIAAGVCPCCNRTFQNLARHMENKHKEYSK